MPQAVPHNPTSPSPDGGAARQRVLLNNPPPTRADPYNGYLPFGCPGLAHVAGYLRRAADCEIAIVDSPLEGLDFERTLERIEDFRPDVVGFTAFTEQIKAAARVAQLVRDRLPGVVTVIGGVHVTALPRETLVEFPGFDVAVYGEGEVTFSELCRALDSGKDVSGIDGLAWRESGGEVRLANPRERLLDLDALPPPAWDLLPRTSLYHVQTVRGCPLACTFCLNPNGRAVRARSVENVLAELEWIIAAWEPAAIHFGDEIFTVDLDRAKALLTAMIDRGIHERVEWAFMTHVRFVDEELFALMGKLKVHSVGMGIETGDEAILKRVGKGATMDMILNARRLARKHGVPIAGLMVIGHPHETVGSIWKTIKLAARLNAEEPVITVMTPFPGTEVAALAARGEAGYRLLSKDWDEYDVLSGRVLQFANLSLWRIAVLQLFAYLSVFLWNFRFLDLARFAWRHRADGLLVVANLARDLFGGTRTPPRSESGARRTVLAEAWAVWREWQVSELGRARRIGRRAESRSSVSREPAP